MTMNRVAGIVLLLSCLCAFIKAGYSVRATGCRDKSGRCSRYVRNGHCTSYWMKRHCARSCGHCSVSKDTTTSSQWFQIHSAGYSQCLAARRVRTIRPYLSTKVTLYLSKCIRGTSGQLWRWTSSGQLQSSVNRQCLAVTRVWKGFLGWSYGVATQPCGSVSSYQEWVCSSGYLKLKNHNLYLVPFVYSGIRRNGGVVVRSTVTSSCLWTRYGTSKSVCENKVTQPTTAPTTSVTTTQRTTAPTSTQITSTTTPSQWFQIRSARYNQCLAARRVRTYRPYLSTKVTLYLSNCIRGTSGQLWRWTSSGQLQSSVNRQCLAVTRVRKGFLGWSYGVATQPCRSVSSYQEWVCSSGYLKLKKHNLYLVPFVYSGIRRNGGVVVRSTVTSSCLWTRYGTSKSVCENKVTHPTTTPTAPVTTTQRTTAPTTQITTLAPQSGWFQIKNQFHRKCLALRNTATLPNTRLWRSAPPLTLETCDANSGRQLWKWSASGQLVLKHNGHCLTGDFWGKTKLQRCSAGNNYQQWSCFRDKLKLKSLNSYLVSYLYSGLPYGFNVRTSRICFSSRSCRWSRVGGGLPICGQVTQRTTAPSMTSTRITTLAPQSGWFQIKHGVYQECLALRNTATLPNTRLWRSAPPVTLETCDANSGRQLWKWSASGQLVLKHNGHCLTGDFSGKTGLERCSAALNFQRWSCFMGKLKLRPHNHYLASYMYSGLPFGFSVRTSALCYSTACVWYRVGAAGLSLCDQGEVKTTTATITSQVTTTQVTTTQVTTTNTPITTTNPSTPANTPPVPSTDDLGSGTPPLPTGDLMPPPFPGNSPPPPPAFTTTRSPPPQGNKNIKCGTKGRVGGVVNGTAAAAGSWPWQVGIKKCAHCNITCGGALINDEWVVTAAHCVTGRFPEDLHIVLGETDQSKKSGHEQKFRGATIIQHEEYEDDAPFDKDIALLRLDNYAVFNDHVRPLCMPAQGTALTDKDLCTVTGFGRIAQFGAKSARLLQANVQVVSLSTCAQSYAALNPPRKVTGNMLCAGYKKGGTDACQGDSGGPLTCFDRSNFRFILGGLVSWGVGCARPNLYGVYTNTALFTPWVQKQLAAYGY